MDVIARTQFKNYWAALVRIFQDEEHQDHGIRYYDSLRLAQNILDYVRYTRIRQWALFVERRGEEYEQMIESLVDDELSKESILRFVEQEDLWKATLEMAVL